jgi:hypothetical protein
MLNGCRNGEFLLCKSLFFKNTYKVETPSLIKKRSNAVVRLNYLVFPIHYFSFLILHKTMPFGKPCLPWLARLVP